MSSGHKMDYHKSDVGSLTKDYHHPDIPKSSMAHGQNCSDGSKPGATTLKRKLELVDPDLIPLGHICFGVSDAIICGLDQVSQVVLLLCTISSAINTQIKILYPGCIE